MVLVLLQWGSICRILGFVVLRLRNKWIPFVREGVEEEPCSYKACVWGCPFVAFVSGQVARLARTIPPIPVSGGV
jgi:hypothetical protein